MQSPFQVQALQEISSWQIGSKCNVLIPCSPLYKLAAAAKTMSEGTSAFHPVSFSPSPSTPSHDPFPVAWWSTALCLFSQPTTFPFSHPWTSWSSFDLTSSVRSVLGSWAHTVWWETHLGFLEPIVVSTGHLRWPSSDCGQHQQPPADPRETGAQANGLCIFLFGCSGVSLDKGILPSAEPHLVSTFLSSLVTLGKVSS